MGEEESNKGHKKGVKWGGKYYAGLAIFNNKR